MQRALISLSALAVAALPALADTKDYAVENFTELDVSEAILVIYENGSSTSVSVEQADGDFSDIKIETKGDTLLIDRESASSGWRSNISTDYRNGELRAKVNGKKVPSYTVRITSPEISSIDASRSARVTADDINADTLTLDASSSADLIISGHANSVSIDASSSSDVEADGLVANRLTIDASSSADVEAQASSDQQVLISASSSADVELELTGTAEVELEASSSSDLELSGTCGQISIVASSSTDIEARDLTCSTATIKASSSADVNLSVTESVEATASSGGDINVYGNPAQRNVRESSGGDVSFKS